MDVKMSGQIEVLKLLVEKKEDDLFFASQRNKTVRCLLNN